MLPIGKAQFDNSNQRVYVHGLTKEQVENLPEYDGSEVNYDYEERVRGVYRENAAAQSAPVAGYTRDNYNYDYDKDLYTAPETTDRNQPIRLYEERLIADKNRMKAGDVMVGKRVETETAKVSVPVEKDRVVIERTAPTTTAAAATGHTFNEGEVARVEVYEETAAVRKEAFVREEVSVRKETEEEIVSESATLRREELDVETDDNVELINR